MGMAIEMAKRIKELEGEVKTLQEQNNFSTSKETPKESNSKEDVLFLFLIFCLIFSFFKFFGSLSLALSLPPPKGLFQT